MPEPDHERIADRLEDEAAAMERHSAELKDAAHAARAEWERKRADPSVPGAPPPEEGDEPQPGEQQTPPS
jgi:hypothetical protein